MGVGNRMRKKSIAVFISIIICLLTACAAKGQTADQEEKIIDVYYLNKENTKVVLDEHVLSGESETELLDEVIQILQTPPEDVLLKAPITDAFRVDKYYLKEKQVVLDVDKRYKELEPTKEVLTRAAIVRTLTQLQEIDYVSINVNGEPLTDMSGNLVGRMSADMFIDNAGTEINTYEKAKLHLYFANSTGDGLVEINRTKVYNSNISLEKLVVEQIIAGPINKESYPTVNPDTKIISVTVKDGTCYVNLNETFLTQIYNVSAETTIYSLVNSLIELANVNKVQILINGKTDIIYRDNISLTTVFERKLELIK